MASTTWWWWRYSLPTINRHFIDWDFDEVCQEPGLQEECETCQRTLEEGSCPHCICSSQSREVAR